MIKYYFTILVVQMAFVSIACLKTVHENEVVRVAPVSIMEPHPRLLLLAGEERQVQKAIDGNADLQKVHTAIIQQCNTFLSAELLKRELTGKRLLSVSRECLKRVFYLAYAYRMTKDERYAKRAGQEMVNVSSFSDWNASHFLDVAEMTLGVAIGYDWLYDQLPENYRQIIKQAIINKGITPSYKSTGTWWINGTNNWNQVCHAGISYGAIAVYEDDKEKADDVLQRAVTNLPNVIKMYNPDGAYPEGYNYWGYGTMFNVLFIDAYEKFKKTTYDLTGLPGFLKTPEYMLHMAGPSNQDFNYSDGSRTLDIQPAMFWFAKEVEDVSLIWNDMKFIENNSPEKLTGERTLPALLIWAKDISLPVRTAPAKTFWQGSGENPVALMRTSWTDPNAIYVGFKCGSPSASHGHMDIGSFVMDADGERWASDFGMQNYYSLESKGVDLWNMNQNSQRWQVFRYNNLAHNTLAVNNQFQVVKGRADISSYSSQPGFMNATAEITKVYDGQLKKAGRGVAIVKDKYVVVRDEVEALNQPTTIRWTMMTTASVEVTGPGTIILKHGSKKLLVTIKSSVPVNIKQWPTTPPNEYDAPNPGTFLIGFEAVLPASAKARFDVFLSPAQNAVDIDYKVPELSRWPKN